RNARGADRAGRGDEGSAASGQGGGGEEGGRGDDEGVKTDDQAINEALGRRRPGRQRAGGSGRRTAAHGGADYRRRPTQPVRLRRRDMAIEVKEIVRRYRYNGVTLPDVAGMSPKEIRDLYSAQYPELVSAEIETGEIVDGVQEITFKRAVGTKG